MNLLENLISDIPFKSQKNIDYPIIKEQYCNIISINIYIFSKTMSFQERNNLIFH